MADEKVEIQGKEIKIHERPLKFLHKWIDDNLRIVRYSSYGLAAIGIIILARNSRPTAKFSQVLEIPDNFITKHVTLQGQVRHVGSTGLLMIDHTPIYRPKILKKPQAITFLPIRLALVEVDESGVEWLQRNARGQHVWFKLLAVDSRQHLECEVYMKKTIFFKSCLNREIIRSGAGVQQPLAPVGHDHDPVYDKLRRTLLRDQMKAEKRKVGLWKEATYWERLKGWSSTDLNIPPIKSNVVQTAKRAVGYATSFFQRK